ncbi:SNF2 family N-terminal domain-containing protein [Auriculariales sp. MPI-PUGE-AT-0066]|nr:SNF2 family N-terminal domain-containing protein [Auriculariales sp. MPI-PUGE-AT-0066]
MRATGTSSHLLSSRSSSHSYGERQHVNIVMLEYAVTLALSRAKNAAIHDTVRAGQKRMKSPSEEAPGALRSAKRAKLEGDTAGIRTAWQLYNHSWTLGFTTEPDGDKSLAGPRYDKEESDLLSALRDLQAASDGAVTIQLDPVDFRLEGSIGHALYLNIANDRTDRPIVRVPPLMNDGFAAEDHGFSEHLADVLMAVLVLKKSGLADITSSMSISYLENVALEESELPFQLHIQTQISMFLPLPAFSQLRRDEAEAQRRLLSHVFSEQGSSHHDAASSKFYYSILKPAPPLPPLAAEALQPESLLPTLLPFQRRSLAVMLLQEGLKFNERGELESCDPTPPIPRLWKQLPAPWALDSEERIYYKPLTGELRTECPIVRHYPGLFVAEEMGLGKTLECIALMLLNPLRDRIPTNVRWDPIAEVEVAEVSTSLVITPISLAQQWADEFAAHSPTLRVFIYDGWDKFEKDVSTFLKPDKGKGKASDNGAYKPRATSRKGKKARSDETDLDENTPHISTAGVARFLHEHVDVVITTYQTLQRDLGVARAPVKRTRRDNVDYGSGERYRSPLIRVEWGRIIMDEAQMVGGGTAAAMVALIPRLVSFAVSGTPVKASVTDLYNTLNFIRIPDAIPSTRVWSRLLLPAFTNDFVELFSSMTVRHLKVQVKDELTIPPQQRLLVPISLGKVERQVYSDALDNAIHALGLPNNLGEAYAEIDTAVLRSSLRLLRGLCTHPMVGQMQQADKAANVVRSIGDVLERMIEQTWREWIEDRRLKLVAETRRAQLVQKQETLAARHHRALDILLATKADSDAHTAEVTAEIERHQNVSAAHGQTSGSGNTALPNEVFITVHDHAAEETRNRLRALKARLREAYIARHKIVFIMGDIYHVLGERFAKEEEKSYSTAETLRKSILQTTASLASDSMSRLRSVYDKLPPRGDLEVEPCGQGALLSYDLMDQGNEVIDRLARQADLIYEWRSALVERLTMQLGNDEPATGNEYEQGIKAQVTAEAYLQAYTSLLADRRESLTSERSVLAALDNQEPRLRKVAKGARKEWQPEEEREAIPLDTVGEDVDHGILLAQLMTKRNVLRDDIVGTPALRFIAADLSRVANRARNKDGNDTSESTIAINESQRLKRVLHDQERILEKLESELQQMRRTFNERLQYFRQLQELSDTVMDVKWDGSLEVAITDVTQESEKLAVGIRTQEARLRYLRNMTEGEQELSDEGNEDAHCCVLCRCDFVQGLITQCAHVFCQSCLTAWLKRGSQACPVCRVPVVPTSVQRIVRHGNDQVAAGSAHSPSAGRSAEQNLISQVNFNTIDPALLRNIAGISHRGSYGSKIGMLVKHLLYIQIEEPGAKSIVFSAWADSLTIIEHALELNDISSLRVDSGRSKDNAARVFRTDPNLQVFLLHGERENAGLNVTCANRVFLVEPVVNHAFEVQAISRIDRMGQTRNTEVLCYFAEDSVEENILKLAAQQGLSMYTSDQSHGSLDATALMTSNPKVDDTTRRRPRKGGQQRGDFVAHGNDLLSIMFPHIFQQSLATAAPHVEELLDDETHEAGSRS